MDFNILGAIVAGLAATLIFTAVMVMAPRMGLPEMDIVGVLGSMFGWPPNRSLGLAIHLMMGAVFAIIYALLWRAGLLNGLSLAVSGAIFGIGHWLIAGGVMAAMPMMHPAIQNGDLPAPGPYMVNRGGTMAFAGGLIGHVIFGLTVGLVYGFFV